MPTLVVSALAAVQPAQASIVATLTPTARLDTLTTTRITYTLSAAADVGTQDVTWYFFRVILTGLPLANSATGFGQNFLTAPTGSPWASSLSGPFTSVLLTPSPTQIRWQGTGSGAVQTVDTLGGIVGSFEFVWNRPTTGQYDAGIAASAVSSAYINNPADPNNANFVVNGAASRIGSGVSTLITAASAVPEPATQGLVLTALLALGAGLRSRRHAAA